MGPAAPDRDPSLRWLRVALPILWCLFAIEVLGGVLRAPGLVWNEIRLSRSLALLDGFHLYPDEQELGPVIGTLHTPVSHYLFIPVATIHDPTWSIIVGSLFACLAVFSTVAFALVRFAPPVSGRWAIAAAAFLFCGFQIIQSEGAFNTAFNIHTDAIALAFATIACAFAVTRNGALPPSSVWISAFATVLAIGSKQTIAPVAVAIALYLVIAQGAKQFVLFLLASAATGGALLAFLLWILPARAFLFNTLTLAAHRPLKHGILGILVETYRMGRLEALPALLPLLFLAIWSWNSASPRPPVRQCFAANPWTVFLLAGTALIPVSTKAIITVGADVNHLGFVLYFFFVAAGLAIQQYFADGNRATRFSARLFLAAGIVAGLAPGMALSVVWSLRDLRNNDSQIAHNYNLRHPGVAYFPFNPMTSLLKDRKAYHLDTALYDREIAGYPLTPRQIQSGLPDRFTLVAVPPLQYIQSVALQRLLAASVRTTDPELPGWTVYRRKP